MFSRGGADGYEFQFDGKHRYQDEWEDIPEQNGTGGMMLPNPCHIIKIINNKTPWRKRTSHKNNTNIIIKRW